MIVKSKEMQNGGGEREPRGPTTVDLPGIGYSADIYHKASYVDARVVLAQKAEILIVRAGLFSPEVARLMVAKGLEGSTPQNTSWIGFRKLGASIGNYDGLSWQEQLKIPTFQGTEQLLYLKLRAFEPEAQRKHLGRTAIQLALNAHPDVRYLAHRTASPAAVRSFVESGVFKEGQRFPYDTPFSNDPLAPHLLLWLYSKYHINGRIPNLKTGVSIADYIEPNKAYVPDPTHAPTKEIHRWMVEKLKMNFQRGDSLMEIGELK